MFTVLAETEAVMDNDADPEEEEEEEAVTDPDGETDPEAEVDPERLMDAVADRDEELLIEEVALEVRLAVLLVDTPVDRDTVGVDVLLGVIRMDPVTLDDNEAEADMVCGWTPG